MRVTVMLFAGLAEKAGMREAVVELPDRATAGELKAAVAKRHPELASLLPSCFVSVNCEYAADDHPVRAGDEIALLPPVSGGEPDGIERETVAKAESGTHGDPRFRVTTDPLSVDELVRLVSHPEAGAVLTFIGTVRELTHGKRTVSLAYEAYVPMAVAKMKEIAAEMEARWPGVRTAMHHRVGQLAVQETAVIIAVATPHRQEAFEAGRYAIERLKAVVPIWKKEVWADGSEWIGHQQGPWNPLAPAGPAKKEDDA